MRSHRPPAVIVAIAVLVTAASCGGASDDDDGADTTPPVTSGFTVAAAATTTTPPVEETFGALGILTLRPVITCEPRSRADDSLGQDLLPLLDGEQECVVGPSSGTGAVFERGSAGAVFNDQIEQWVVNVDLRSDGEAVWDAAALPCFNQQPTCPTGQLAIVLDGVIQSAPLVQTPDFPAAVQISGSFTEAQARSLAEVLNRVVEPIDDPDDRDDVLPTTLAPTTAPPPPVDTTTPERIEEAPVVDWDGTYRQKTTPGRSVQLGDISPFVEQLQQALSRLGYPLDADGYFGYGTESAVRQFQRDRGLPVTGIASDDVWDALAT